MLGGEGGEALKVEAGDVLIIPAGVGHKNLGQEHQVSCIGAYPKGRDYDIKTGQPGDRPGTDHTIAKLPIPLEDPVYGRSDGVPAIWSALRSGSFQ